MSTITRTGYEQDQQGAWISKDPSAKLIYSFDWSQWLTGNDTVSSVSYTLQVRTNGPAPLVRESQGVTSGGKITFVELSGGQVGKIYTVTAQVTTSAGGIDRRNFRVKIENRSA
jgi:hypothetical protein